MKIKKLLSIFTFIFLLPTAVLAADYITCESEDGRYRYCSAARYPDFKYSDVELDKQYSKQACAQGYSWGLERNGIWVDRGCRARFVILNYRDRPGYPDNDRDRDDRYDREKSYENNTHKGLYGSYGKSSEQLRREREGLELERERLRLERERLELQNAQSATLSKGCPVGSKPGRCSDFDRKRGCKDWRLSNGLGCRTN